MAQKVDVREMTREELVEWCEQQLPVAAHTAMVKTPNGELERPLLKVILELIRDTMPIVDIGRIRVITDDETDESIKVDIAIGILEIFERATLNGMSVFQRAAGQFTMQQLPLYSTKLVDVLVRVIPQMTLVNLLDLSETGLDSMVYESTLRRLVLAALKNRSIENIDLSHTNLLIDLEEKEDVVFSAMKAVADLEDKMPEGRRQLVVLFGSIAEAHWVTLGKNAPVVAKPANSELPNPGQNGKRARIQNESESEDEDDEEDEEDEEEDA